VNTLKELYPQFAELKSFGVSDTASAILVLAEAIKNLEKGYFEHAMQQFGHELSLSLKDVLKYSVIQTETEINGNLAVTVEKL
jgi:hypothetical protein